jgi:protein-tyrosine phosphatase
MMFACYGNICRSPVAEQLSRQRSSGRTVSSTGLLAINGRSTPRRIRRAATELGVDVGAHRSTRTENAHVDAADVVLLMDPLNYRIFRDRFPHALDKILFLGMFRAQPSLEIRDPVDLDEAGARESALATREAIDGLMRWLGEDGNDT